MSTNPTTTDATDTTDTTTRSTIADEGVNAVAIAALVVVSIMTQADPTTIVAAIGGIAGYRMRQRKP